MSDRYFPPYKIIENHLLTVPGPPMTVVRTRRERLFSRPWMPLQRTRTVIPQIPSTQIYQVGDTLVMHPVMAERMRRELLHR